MRILELLLHDHWQTTLYTEKWIFKSVTLRIKGNMLPDFICRVRDSSCRPEGLIWSTVISELTFRHNYILGGVAMNRKVLEDCVSVGDVSFYSDCFQRYTRYDRNIFLLAQTTHSCVRSSLEHLLRTAHITFPQGEKSICRISVWQLFAESYAPSALQCSS